MYNLKWRETGIYVPQGPSLWCEPDQSAYSKTEIAAVVESGVCRVFDKAPVAVNKTNKYICHCGISHSTKQILYIIQRQCIYIKNHQQMYKHDYKAILVKEIQSLCKKKCWHAL